MSPSYLNILAYLKSKEIVNIQIAALLIEQELKENGLDSEKERELILDLLFHKLIEVLKDKDFEDTKIVFEILSGEIEVRIKQSVLKYESLKNTLVNILKDKDIDFELMFFLGKQLFEIIVWFPEDGDVYNKILTLNQAGSLSVSPFFFYRYLVVDIDRAIANGVVTGAYCERLGWPLYPHSFEATCHFILDCFDKLIGHIQQNRPALYEMSIDDLPQEQTRQLMKSIGEAIKQIEKRFLAIEEKTIKIYAVFDRTKKVEQTCRKELFAWVF